MAVRQTLTGAGPVQASGILPDDAVAGCDLDYSVGGAAGVGDKRVAVSQAIAAVRSGQIRVAPDNVTGGIDFDDPVVVAIGYKRVTVRQAVGLVGIVQARPHLPDNVAPGSDLEDAVAVRGRYERVAVGIAAGSVRPLDVGMDIGPDQMLVAVDLDDSGEADSSTGIADDGVAVGESLDAGGKRKPHRSKQRCRKTENNRRQQHDP